jgi:hypothetical protein
VRVALVLLLLRTRPRLSRQQPTAGRRQLQQRARACPAVARST